MTKKASSKSTKAAIKATAKPIAPKDSKSRAKAPKSTTSEPKKTSKSTVTKPSKTTKATASKPKDQIPVLLTGGNPQIPKGDGDGPVQAYIAAMPGWKRDIGQQLDSLIMTTVPDVQKAVKWNSPFYGLEGKGWFLSFHCFTKYIKLTFFSGASLRPLPPGSSKQKEVRYFDIYESETLDQQTLRNWIKQASELSGWIP